MNTQKNLKYWKQLVAAAFRVNGAGFLSEQCVAAYKLLKKDKDHGKPDPEGNEVYCWFPDCEVCAANWWLKAHAYGYRANCQFMRCELCGPTFLEGEEKCYPDGAMKRKGVAIIMRNPHNPIELPYEMLGNVIAGIADTAWTVPARLLYKGKRIKGYVSSYRPEGYPFEGACDQFQPSPDREKCIRCNDGEGCKRDSDYLTSVKVRANC